MDDRPIDPFNPYARRYSPPPPQWPPPTPAADDTQEVPVVPVAPTVSMDDTQEVPVVPAHVAPAAPPEPTALIPAQRPVAPVAEPAAPFAPELTVPADLVSKRPHRPRKAPLVAIGAGVVGLLVIVTVVIFAFQPGPADGSPDNAAATTGTPDATADSSSSSAKESKSPSKNSKPEKDKTSTDEASKPGGGGDDGGGDDKPEPNLSTPSRPTKFGAWFAGGGNYQAKWGAPSDDGGADIVSYVIGDCKGNNLAFVDSNTFKVTVQADYLDCMSVYAVNNQGIGTDAQHHITNNP